VTIDAVNRPAHYNATETETIDYIHETLRDEAFVEYCRGNALKYLSRAGKKGDSAEDMAKAAWYAQMAAHTLCPEQHRDPRQSEQGSTLRTWRVRGGAIGSGKVYDHLSFSAQGVYRVFPLRFATETPPSWALTDLRVVGHDGA
jgi:hypothetical protein